jgi:hypothetical protein
MRAIKRNQRPYEAFFDVYPSNMPIVQVFTAQAAMIFIVDSATAQLQFIAQFTAQLSAHDSP